MVKTSFNVNDIVGQTFNEFKVISFDHKVRKKYGTIYYYNCKCSCGKEFICERRQIRSGKTKSCGHLNYQIKDISGNRYGRLKVLNLDHIKNTRSFYKCICDCGNNCIVARDALVNGRTKSCGCYSREIHSNLRKTHGMSNTRIFRIWQHILGRCINHNDDSYFRYGGRGIFVCREWIESFKNFYDDMGEEYYKMAKIYGEENISINRIDNNDGYYKENCEWATKKEQQNNQRGNIIVNINNQKYTLFEAYTNFAIPSLSYTLVRTRYIRLHWNIIDALTTPISSNTYIPEEKESNDTKYTRDKRAFYFDLDLIKNNNISTL